MRALSLLRRVTACAATQAAASRQHAADSCIVSLWDAAAYGCSPERARALVAIAIGESEDTIAEEPLAQASGRPVSFSVHVPWSVSRARA